MIHLSSTYWCQDSSTLKNNTLVDSPELASTIAKKKKKKIVSSNNTISDSFDLADYLAKLEKKLSSPVDLSIEDIKFVLSTIPSFVEVKYQEKDKNNPNQLSLFDTISEPQFKATKIKSIDDAF